MVPGVQVERGRQVPVGAADVEGRTDHRLLADVVHLDADAAGLDARAGLLLAGRQRGAVIAEPAFNGGRGGQVGRGGRVPGAGHVVEVGAAAAVEGGHHVVEGAVGAQLRGAVGREGPSGGVIDRGTVAEVDVEHVGLGDGHVGVGNRGHCDRRSHGKHADKGKHHSFQVPEPARRGRPAVSDRWHQRLPHGMAKPPSGIGPGGAERGSGLLVARDLRQSGPGVRHARCWWPVGNERSDIASPTAGGVDVRRPAGHVTGGPSVLRGAGCFGSRASGYISSYVAGLPSKSRPSSCPRRSIAAICSSSSSKSKIARFSA